MNENRKVLWFSVRSWHVILQKRKCCKFYQFITWLFNSSLGGIFSPAHKRQESTNYFEKKHNKTFHIGYVPRWKVLCIDINILEFIPRSWTTRFVSIWMNAYFLFLCFPCNWNHSSISLAIISDSKVGHFNAPFKMNWFVMRWNYLNF